MQNTKNRHDRRLFEIASFALAFGVGHYEKYITIAFIVVYFVFYLLARKKRCVLHKRSEGIPLLLWGFIYVFYEILYGADPFTSAVYFLIGPMCLYLYADQIVKPDTNEQDIVKLCLIISAGYFLHGILSILVSIRLRAFQINAEHILDFWTHEKHNRTIIGMYLTPIFLCGVPTALFLGDYIKKAHRLLIMAGCCVSIIASIYVGNRTLLVIAAFTVFLCVAQGIIISKKKGSIIAVSIFLLILALIMIQMDVFGLKEFVQNSFLAKRNTDGLSSSRWQVYGDIAKNMWAYRFGFLSTQGSSGIALGYAHNLWLDVLIFSGYIPFALLMIFTLKVIAVAIRMQRRQVTVGYRILVLCTTAGILLNWAVEPVLSANPYYFMQCCLMFALFEKHERVLKSSRK